MKRKEIVERIAAERSVPLHTAADLFDSLLHQWIRQIRNGGSIDLPNQEPELQTTKKPANRHPKGGG